MKKKILLFVTIALSMLMSFSAFADGGEWVKEGNDWKYKKNGTFLKKKWETVDGTSYYFDNDGNMAKGLTKIGSYYYMFGDDGVPHEATGNFPFNGKIYSISGKGKITNLEQDITVEFYEEYKSGAQTKQNKAAKLEANKELIEKLKACAGSYAHITADNVNLVVIACSGGIDFMSCANRAINEIRTQLKESYKKYVQLAKLPANANNLSTYIAEYKQIEADYKDLANKFLAELNKTYNPKVDIYGKVQGKYADVFTKVEADFEDDLTSAAERASNMNDDD